MTRETKSSAKMAETRRRVGVALIVGAILSLILAVFHTQNPISNAMPRGMRSSLCERGTVVMPKV